MVAACGQKSSSTAVVLAAAVSEEEELAYVEVMGLSCGTSCSVTC